jgi:hypothetical protein
MSSEVSSPKTLQSGAPPPIEPFRQIKDPVREPPELPVSLNPEHSFGEMAFPTHPGPLSQSKGRL